MSQDEKVFKYFSLKLRNINKNQFKVDEGFKFSRIDFLHFFM